MTCRCTICRCEVDDDGEEIPVCTDCKCNPDATLDRDALDKEYQAGLERTQRRGAIH